jgi:hypothetical protein
VRQNIPGAADTRIVNWQAAERGLSTETFLFDLQDGVDGPTTLNQLVFRRPPALSLYSDYDLTRQVMVMNRLRDRPITVPTVCWLDRDDKDLGTPYYVIEQIPTISPRATFPRIIRHGLYSGATPKSEPPWVGLRAGHRRCARVGQAKPSTGQAADAAAWRATGGTGRRLLRRAAEVVVAGRPAPRARRRREVVGRQHL